MKINRKIGLLMAAIVLLLVSIVAMWRFKYRVHNGESFDGLLSNLTPGMTRSQVTSSIPSRFLIREEYTTNVPWRTVLNPQDAQVESCLEYYSDPPDWKILWEPKEFCNLYFDSSNRLVGIKYTASPQGIDPTKLKQWQISKH